MEFFGLLLPNMKHVLVSITGYGKEYAHHSPIEPWQNKLKEIKKRDITEIALFLELYNRQEKQEIYAALLDSGVKSIPVVHLRHDMHSEELLWLRDRFGTKYFTCHEENFARHDMEKWHGFYRNIYLEMNFDDFVSKTVQVEKIGGFCVDLAHFKCGMEKLSKDFDYVWRRRQKHIFKCNHLNGWDGQKNVDMHTIKSLKDFDYIKTLPDFLFGNYIALETFNPISEQVEFKEYTKKLLQAKSG